MQMRIAINGFGRIGRSFFRAAFAAPSEALAKEGMPAFDIVAINDIADVKTLAYLLKYDSIYGRYKKEVKTEDGVLMIEGKRVKVFAEKDPSKLPWRDLGIDIVVESAGLFASAEKSRTHIQAGAKRVVITAPASGEVTTALIGVNDDRFASLLPITSNASCTTNSIAPVLKILLDEYGIRKAAMTTIHAYTGTQKVIDSVDVKDLRRGRAAGLNIVPSSTGAAEAVVLAIPELKGKFEAVSARVPVAAGSLSVLNILVDKQTSADEVNDLFRRASMKPRWAKILKVTDDPIVSSDILGESYGAIIDAALTKVSDGDLLTVFSWYDNEAGYTATLIEHVKRVISSIEVSLQ